MANAFMDAEIKAHLLHIINERDQLRAELMHAKSAIVELEKQNLEYGHLLNNVLLQFEACKPKCEVNHELKIS